MNRARARALFVSGLFALLTFVPLGASTRNQASPAAASSAALLDILRAEMARNMAVLEQQPVPPYFLAYSVNESRSSQLSASFGAVTGDQDNHSRDARRGRPDRRLRSRQHARDPGRAGAARRDRAGRRASHRLRARHLRRRVECHRPRLPPGRRAARPREDESRGQGEGRGPGARFLARGPAGLRRLSGIVPAGQGGMAGPSSPALRGLLRRPAHRPWRSGAERRSQRRATWSPPRARAS